MYCVYQIYLDNPLSSRAGNSPVAAFMMKSDAAAYVTYMEEKYELLKFILTDVPALYIKDGSEDD